MNKLSVGLLLAASFFFIDVSPATAHPAADHARGYAHGYHFEERRRHQMPRWLKRNKQFRHWYRHTPLRHYRQIRWRQLFEIYRWERRYFRTGRRLDDRNFDRHHYGDRRRDRYDD